MHFPRFAPLASLLLVACSGEIGDINDPGFLDSSIDGRQSDAGLDGFIIPAECGEAGPAIVYFETTCAALGACHQGGGQFPDLTRAGLPLLDSLMSERRPDEPLLVPGDAAGSWLYRKMADLQGVGAGGVMPAGRNRDWAELPADVVAIREWINGGAPTECDGLPPTGAQVDPNTLDADSLFACGDPSAPRSSPARVRRIEREEFTHMVSRRLDGADTSVIDNPLLVPVQYEYPTYTEGVTLNAGALNLLLLILPQATEHLRGPARGDALASENVLRPEVRCIFDNESPDAECIDTYVELLLTRGSEFRTPSEWTRTHTRDYLVAALARESDVSERRATLELVIQSTLLTSGALFRDEVPTGEADVAGRARLSGEQTGLALGRLLSSHPPGSLKTNYHNILTGDPDNDRLEEGWLAAIGVAATIPEGAPGSIHDPEVRRSLVQRYGGGTDPGRHDIYLDFYSRWQAYPATASRHGQYWVATEFRRFFRQWLDYDSAASSFKDTPAATSRFEDADRIDEVMLYLQGSSNVEVDIAQHLDDTIARTIVDTHIGAGHFFEQLMLGRTWHLPATDHFDERCTETAECTQLYDHCTHLGDCRPTNPRTRAVAPMLYGIDGVIDATQEGRWQQVPAGERLGVLTNPAWLAAHGGNFEDDASMIDRGKWIRERLFCQSIPPLSLVEVEAQLVPSSPELTARDRVRLSTEEGDPTCFTCHGLMNSLGAPFELFNHAGFVRESDHGSAPNGSTVIDNLPTNAGDDINGSYDTPFEFIQAIAASTQAKRGFIRHAFRYFMGRDETLDDACTLAAMENALNDNGSFIDMIAELAASETFVFRHMDLTEGGE